MFATYARKYEACPESTDTKVLNMYNILIYKSDTVNELPTIALFFNIVAGIVQTFIKTCNQLLYPRVIEVCLLPFEPRHDILHLIIVVELFPSEMFLYVKKQVEIAGREVRTVRRMVQYIPLEFFQKRSGDVRGNGATRCRGTGTRRVTTFPFLCFEWLVEAVSRCRNMQRHYLLSQEACSRPGECIFCPTKGTP